MTSIPNPPGPPPTAMPDGFKIYAGYLDRAAQERLVDLLRHCLTAAPLYTPTLPRSGKPFSVRMSNAGSLGWVSDRVGGYRYQATHPVTGQPWPDIPEPVLDIWRDLAGYPALPEACLINWYAPDARMGLHQDRDEAARDAPVLSISLGDTALFRIGAADKRAPTRSLRLASGDVALLSGPARDARHGIDRLYPGTSTLLDQPGRINLTLRRVTATPDPAGGHG